MRLRLGVLFGGVSVEHEVSIITALQAIENIDKNRYEVVPIFIDKDGSWYTGEMLKDIKIYSDKDLLKRYAYKVALVKKEGRFVLLSLGFLKREIKELDICFPIMHGTYGEDGALQGYLETIGIPVCECDHYAGVVGQDKIFMKQIWNSEGIETAKFKWSYDTDYFNNPDKFIKECEKIGYPLIVKPARLGSSVGIKVSKNEQELRDNISDAFNYDTKVIVEEMIQNIKEVNISVLGNYRKVKTSVIEEVGGSDEFLTYEDKYISGNKKGCSKGMASAKRLIPANISDELAEKIKETAIKCYKSLNASGVVRIDFLIDQKTNKIYPIEINSIPGSLSFYLWDKTNLEYRELLDEVINIGIKDFKDKRSKVTTFKTNILTNYENRGVKGIKGIKK